MQKMDFVVKIRIGENRFYKRKFQNSGTFPRSDFLQNLQHVERPAICEEYRHSFIKQNR